MEHKKLPNRVGRIDGTAPNNFRMRTSDTTVMAEVEKCVYAAKAMARPEEESFVSAFGQRWSTQICLNGNGHPWNRSSLESMLNDGCNPRV